MKVFLIFIFLLFFSFLNLNLTTNSYADTYEKIKTHVDKFDKNGEKILDRDSVTITWSAEDKFRMDNDNSQSMITICSNGRNITYNINNINKEYSLVTCEIPNDFKDRFLKMKIKSAGKETKDINSKTGKPLVRPVGLEKV